MFQFEGYTLDIARSSLRAADPARLKTDITTLASEQFGGRLTRANLAIECTRLFALS